MYRLIEGDIFDRKCDLLVVPCNNHGGVTNPIQKSLCLYELPKPDKEIAIGDVIFKNSPKNFPNAQMIGFAASVNVLKGYSKEMYLYSIANKILNYCEKNALYYINIPLLGSGAGGLSPQTSFNVFKKCFEKNEFIILNIFAHDQNIYNSLLEQYDTSELIIKKPRVFISYTRDDPNNIKWVRELAIQLIKNGIDARLDQFHLKLGQDLPQWMTNELSMADKVLLICDKHYARKADSRSAGVGWETMIIQGDMLSHQNDNKYICIVREDAFDRGIPLYIKSKFSLHCKEDVIPDQEFKRLLVALFDCDVPPQPEEIPAFIKELYKKKYLLNNNGERYVSQE